MNALLRFLFLSLLAVGLAIFVSSHPGEVILFYPPYRIELSLNFFLTLTGLLFLLLYGILRGIYLVVHLPEVARNYRQRQRNRKANQALRNAVTYFFSGRFVQAERAAKFAAGQADNRTVAALIGARAAHARQEYERSDLWLSSAENQETQEAILLSAAELHLNANDAKGALGAISKMRSQAGRRVQTLRLSLRAHQLLGNWRHVMELLKPLEKRKALHPTALTKLKQTVYENVLRDYQYDAEQLLLHWKKFPKDVRLTPSVTYMAAGFLIALDHHQEARDMIEQSLSVHWESGLLRRYPQSANGDALPMIQKAERWLTLHPNDPDLLFALGCLCQHQGLWGKAQDFLERAIGYSQDKKFKANIHFTLAQLFDVLSQEQPQASYAKKAYEHYQLGAALSCQNYFL